MDKRTIVFLFLLTVTFFFVHSFFSKKSNERVQQELQVRQEQQERQLVVNEQEAMRRTAPLSNLPVVTLYADKTLKTVAVAAAQSGESFITFPFSDDLPETLFTADGRALALIIDEGKGGPVLYALSDEPSIPSTYLPQIGSADLQFVTVGSDNPQVVLGEYIDGRVVFPSTPPNADAIALFRLDNAYLPVGYYLGKKGRYYDLSSNHRFDDLLTMTQPQAATFSPTQEEFYVLENEYQQIVFSNRGGSIVEINLPLATKENSSIVQATGFDRKIQSDDPLNDTFPNFSYQIVDDQGQVVTKQPTEGGYYPLIRRTIKGANRESTELVSPRFYTMSILSDDPDLPMSLFRVTQFTRDSIEFEANLQGRRITKSFKLPVDNIIAPYTLDATVKVDGDARGLWISTGVPEVEIVSNRFSPTLKYFTTVGAKQKVEKISLPKKESTTLGFVQPDWVSNSNGFFSLILDPQTPISSGVKAEMIPGPFDPTRLTLIDREHDLYPAAKYAGYNLLLPLEATGKTQQFRLYAGPLERALLRHIDTVLTNPMTGINPGYINAMSFHGWLAFISEPFAKFLFILMNMFHNITSSWGFSIILLTVALRLMLYPLNAWSIKANIRMQKIAPKVTEIQKKYKNDPQRVQLETMQLYKESGANPFVGCLPLLIQMPFLIGMFELLKSSFVLRGASFIPGWIDNLSAPDVLFSWSTPIIFFGTEFHLLPFLLGGVMYVQQKWMQAKNAKGPVTDQQKQSQNMGTIMTIVFTVIFYRFPSGLNLYWMSSMGLSVLQQIYMTKKYGGETPAKVIKAK